MGADARGGIGGNGGGEPAVRFAALRRLAAGALSGAAAKTAVAPFDRTKILMQVSQMYGTRQYSGGVLRTMRAIQQTEGVRGFFRGNSATVARIMPYSALQYSAFEFYNRNLALYVFRDPDSKSPTKRLLAGSLSGLTSATLTYPIDLARTRLAVETGLITNKLTPKRGLLATLLHIYATGGLPGMYMGAYPTLVGVVPYSGISFLTFGVLKGFCTDYDVGSAWPVVVNMAAGGAAGLTAQTITYPLDMVRRRLQALHSPAKMTRSERQFLRASMAGAGASTRLIHFSIVRSIAYIVRKEGYKGLYKGVSLNFVKTVPAMAISFTIYDRLRMAFNVPSDKYSATSG